MEKDFKHVLNLLQTFREAGLRSSTIESVIQGMQIGDVEKRAMSILNHGQAKESMKFPNPNLMYYFCYKTTSEDYRMEFNPSSLTPYTAQIGNISYN